jgi:hypothetical protein
MFIPPRGVTYYYYPGDVVNWMVVAAPTPDRITFVLTGAPGRDDRGGDIDRWGESCLATGE